MHANRFECFWHLEIAVLETLSSKCLGYLAFCLAVLSIIHCFQNSCLRLQCSLKRSWLSCPWSTLSLPNPFSQVCVKICLYVNLHDVSYSMFLSFSFWSLLFSLSFFLSCLFIPSSILLLLIYPTICSSRSGTTQISWDLTRPIARRSGGWNSSSTRHGWEKWVC